MKILANKTFNKVFASEYLNTTLKPNAQVFGVGEFKIYADINTDQTVIDGSFPQVLFVPQSYLDIIDTLNSLEWLGTLDLGVGVNLDLVINTLYSGNRTERNLCIDFILGKGLITSIQASQAKTLTSELNAFDPAQLAVNYSDIEDVYTYSFDTPVELAVPYNSANNVGTGGAKDKLFLVMLSQVSTAYGNVTAVNGGAGVYSPLHTFYNPTREVEVKQSSYIATEIGDINDLEATPDLKYDHMDLIDYIDSFRMRFRLPRVIV